MWDTLRGKGSNLPYKILHSAAFSTLINSPQPGVWSTALWIHFLKTPVLKAVPESSLQDCYNDN